MALRYRLAIITGAVVLVLGVACALTTEYLRFNGSGDLLLTPDPTMLRPRSLCILNPVRDRMPERAAEALMTRLRSHGPNALDSVLAGTSADRREQLTANERAYPILTWRIGNRRAFSDRSELQYWVTRGGAYPPDAEEEVHVTVRRAGAAWVVDSFAAIY